eukprot:c971_g1_i1 orf=326-823(-)
MDSDLVSPVFFTQEALDPNFHERLKLIAFSFQEAYSAVDDSDEDSGCRVHRPPTGLEGYWNRQVFLRSYRFTREQTIHDRIKSYIRKFQSSAWAFMTSTCKTLPAKKMKEKVKSTLIYLRRGRYFAEAYAIHLPHCFSPAVILTDDITEPPCCPDLTRCLSNKLF